MAHNDTVRGEFARQAATFARSETLSAADLTDVVADALGDLGGARVLDVACGPGILTDALRRTGAGTVGVDLTPDVLRLARERADPGAAFVRGLAEALPFAPRAFAGAAIRLALHHVEDPAAVLRAVRGVLAPGGRLVVLDALTSPDAGTAALHNAIERLRDPSHAAFADADALAASISGAGFDAPRVTCWERPRRYAEWAAIVNEPTRMDALESVLRALARAGNGGGIALREEDGELWFTYRFGLFVAEAV